MKIYAENDIDIDIITNISVGTLQQTRILVVSVVVKLWSFVRDSYVLCVHFTLTYHSRQTDTTTAIHHSKLQQRAGKFTIPKLLISLNPTVIVTKGDVNLMSFSMTNIH